MNASPFKKGDKVKHASSKKKGIGKVLEIDEGDQSCRVQFEHCLGWFWWDELVKVEENEEVKA